LVKRGRFLPPLQPLLYGVRLKQEPIPRTTDRNYLSSSMGGLFVLIVRVTDRYQTTTTTTMTYVFAMAHTSTMYSTRLIVRMRKWWATTSHKQQPAPHQDPKSSVFLLLFHHFSGKAALTSYFEYTTVTKGNHHGPS
jgi:hypothetical protein